ncbi:phage tail protein [Gloeobacter violaceus]|uniref:Glr4102 protein n=1 Tax=Gloeobacter violaceus (strain ATCC 29082 / PCC 7421) TaxID=251221 RepID=Q7NDY0_GLOVI|nr:phage tail protein [Gloeobacter violaceus]BAC92043.1 glr4102 [Gloeobacter violaceus PCC 7421]
MVAPEKEYLVATHYYFSAESIEDRAILAVSNINAASPIAGKNEPIGAKKSGMHVRQATPTRQTFQNMKVKLVMNQDNAIQKWYRDCNKQHTSTGNTWKENRKLCWIAGFTQDGTEVVRYELVNTYPVSYVGPMFGAASGEMAVETVDLQFEEMNTIGRELGDL